MPKPRRYRKPPPAPLPPRAAPIAPPPEERPRMVWRRQDGRGDIPADLWELMQEGGRRLAEAPTAHRAAQLLVLTEHAAFKTWQPGLPAPWANEPPAALVEAAKQEADEWWT